MKEKYGKGLNVDTESSGPGLYISKQKINVNNGDIFAESEGRNKDTSFTIRLFKDKIFYETDLFFYNFIKI